MATAGLVAGGVAVATLGVMVARTVAAGKRAKVLAAVPTDPLHDAFLARKAGIAEALADAIRLPTVSYDRPDVAHRRPACMGFHKHAGGAGETAACGPAAGVERTAALEAYWARDDVRASRAALVDMHALLAARFPRMHTRLLRTVVNGHSLAFVWPGTDVTAQAIGLYAHMDVVPADDAAAWAHPPFGGDVADGYVWGRGAIDDKQSVIGICAAVEYLLEAGYVPRRTVVLLFGHDEEIGGDEGAAELAHWVQHNVTAGAAGQKPLEFLLDEGLFVLRGAVPTVAPRTALICTAEKGFVNVEASVTVEGGHASAPPAATAIGIVSKAVTALEASPFPSHFSDAGPVPHMFDTLLPYLAFPMRFLFANRWATSRLIDAVFGANPKTALLVRTTTAPTIIRGGTKANTLPATASAVINHRIHPTESVASVLARDAAVIADPRVTLRAFGGVEPSPVSSHTSPAFALLTAAVEGIFVDTVAAPALMVGATDSHWSEHLADNLYRHCPTEMHASETGMFHGRDERIGVDNLARIAAFYARVISDGAS